MRLFSAAVWKRRAMSRAGGVSPIRLPSGPWGDSWQVAHFAAELSGAVPLRYTSWSRRAIRRTGGQRPQPPRSLWSLFLVVRRPGASWVWSRSYEPCCGARPPAFNFFTGDLGGGKRLGPTLSSWEPSAHRHSALLVKLRRFGAGGGPGASSCQSSKELGRESRRTGRGT